MRKLRRAYPAFLLQSNLAWSENAFMGAVTSVKTGVYRFYNCALVLVDEDVKRFRNPIMTFYEDLRVEGQWVDGGKG